MIKFLKRILLFFIPFILFLFIYILFDPFKVIYTYDNYYSKSDFVSINRAVVNTKTYLKNRKAYKYNSFIFGSSRTLAVKCNDWKLYLTKDANLFHYDGNAENLRGIRNKIKFIERQGDTIKNALIFVDQMLLASTVNNEGHLYVDHPKVSGDNWLSYHLLFIEAFSNPKFFASFFYYSFTGQYKSFMGSRILVLKHPNVWDPITSDLYLGLDTEIAKDSISYFSNLYYIMDLKNKIKPETLIPTDKEIELLKDIKEVFDKHKTKYKIVSNPFVSQFTLCDEQKELLKNIFEKDNFYDYSGASKFSFEVHNFYDPSHFRPKVAREILKEIYKN